MVSYSTQFRITYAFYLIIPRGMRMFWRTSVVQEKQNGGWGDTERCTIFIFFSPTASNVYKSYKRAT